MAALVFPTDILPYRGILFLLSLLQHMYMFYVCVLMYIYLQIVRLTAMDKAC